MPIIPWVISVLAILAVPILLIRFRKRDVFRASKGFIIALTYSSQSRVGEERPYRRAAANSRLARSSISFPHRRSSVTLLVSDSRSLVRIVLRIAGADEYMELSVR
jgi:hypothetical protein